MLCKIFVMFKRKYVFKTIDIFAKVYKSYMIIWVEISSCFPSVVKPPGSFEAPQAGWNCCPRLFLAHVVWIAGRDLGEYFLFQMYAPPRNKNPETWKKTQNKML